MEDLRRRLCNHTAPRWYADLIIHHAELRSFASESQHGAKKIRATSSEHPARPEHEMICAGSPDGFLPLQLAGPVPVQWARAVRFHICPGLRSIEHVVRRVMHDQRA